MNIPLKRHQIRTDWSLEEVDHAIPEFYESVVPLEKGYFKFKIPSEARRLIFSVSGQCRQDSLGTIVDVKLSLSILQFFKIIPVFPAVAFFLFLSSIVHQGTETSLGIALGLIWCLLGVIVIVAIIRSYRQDAAKALRQIIADFDGDQIGGDFSQGQVVGKIKQ